MATNLKGKGKFVSLLLLHGEKVAIGLVGVIALWYPVLTDNRQAGMVRALQAAHPEALTSEVRFPPARPGHGMVGSGMFIINPPWGVEDEAARLKRLCATL